MYEMVELSEAMVVNKETESICSTQTISWLKEDTKLIEASKKV